MSTPVTALLEHPIPSRLARRPRDARGFPIPQLVLIRPDGTPDFRITDIVRWKHVVDHRCCALCGEPLGARIAFIGGPLAHENRVFTDPAMHLECAQYAMRVCPYLALVNSRHARKVAPIEGVVVSVTEEVSPEKPERFFIGVTRRYTPYQMGDSLVVRAEPWEHVEWHEPRPPDEKRTAQGCPLSTNKA